MTALVFTDDENIDFVFNEFERGPEPVDAVRNTMHSGYVAPLQASRDYVVAHRVRPQVARKPHDPYAIVRPDIRKTQPIMMLVDSVGAGIDDLRPLDAILMREGPKATREIDGVVYHIIPRRDIICRIECAEVRTPTLDNQALAVAASA